MSGPDLPDLPDLYEQDFYLWTEAQAEALRARGRSGNALDYDRLAEEVEDLGKSEHRAARSYVTRIIEHLFKLAWSAREEPKGGWRGEIVSFRSDALAAMTPSIRAKIEAELAALHVTAARAVALQFETQEPDAARNPALRWSLAQILGEADDPVEQRP